MLDHPVASFVAAHRSAALTSVMKAVSVAGGPAGMTVVALAASLLIGAAAAVCGALAWVAEPHIASPGRPQTATKTWLREARAAT